MTAPAHVLVFRPLIEILRGRGAEVEVTARSYAQTLELLELHGIEAEVFGQHAGRSRLAKARTMASRLRALHQWAKPRRFDVALTHASHELTMTAKRLGIPSSTTFDYEFAWFQHQLGCRAATRVIVPAAIPPERLERYGVKPPKLRRYEGLKEEYYLSDFEPNRAVAASLSLDPGRMLAVVRTPPDIALYHRHENPLFPRLLERLGRQEDLQAVVLPRTREQGEFVRSLGLPSLVVPERAVDAQSLIGLADLVVSAGGTMNREAAALGVPVYTTFGGRLGGVDEQLIREGRLVRITDPEAIIVRRHDSAERTRVRRDPAELLDLLLSV